MKPSCNASMPTRPDILMVGMGMPRQEFWTQENYDRVDAHIILSSNGAALDYVAGAIPTPTPLGWPNWAGMALPAGE